jgi:hypothetical protein
MWSRYWQNTGYTIPLSQDIYLHCQIHPEFARGSADCRYEAGGTAKNMLRLLMNNDSCVQGGGGNILENICYVPDKSSKI